MSSMNSTDSTAHTSRNILYTKYLQRNFGIKISIFVTSVELNMVTKQTVVRAVRTTCLCFILIIAVFLIFTIVTHWASSKKY
jgi:cell division septal protein FtsQ